MNFLIFYFKYPFIKYHLKKLYKNYLMEGGTISLSYIKKQVVLKKYSFAATTSKDQIAIHLNQILDFFKIDDIKTTHKKIIFSSANLPKEARLPKKYIAKSMILPIGITSGKVIEVNTRTTSSTGILIPAGAGKTFFIVSSMMIWQKLNWLDFEEVVIVDVKKDEDFYIFETDPKCKILKTIEQVSEYYDQLEEKIQSNQNPKTLIIFDEYSVYANSENYKNNREKLSLSKNIANKIELGTSLWRSKGIHQVIINQKINKTDNPINMSSVANLIIGYITPAQAQQFGEMILPTQISRGDLVKGKFLISTNFSQFKIFKGLER